MSKVKINLVSGSFVEKPLVTCFKGTNGDYIVLDNETNGSMGYPIICISKINGSNVSKITDQGEWASVKENLKTIIAGTALPYLAVPETLSAQDDFYTQLTLPVASFDLLKNVYSAPAAPSASAEPEMTPAAPEIAPVTDIPVAPMPEISPIAPAEDIAPVAMDPIIPVEPVTSEIPSVEAPVINNMDAPIAPVVEAPIMSTMEMPSAPVDITPVIEPAVSDMPLNDDLAIIKENFMKSCETMFDALVKKFENK